MEWDVSDAVLVGVDGGGTTTRTLVADRRGRVLGYGEAGGASPEHNDESVARDNVRTAIDRALATADSDLADVVGLTAGLAGLDDEADEVWAREFVALDDLGCDPAVVNDAVVAHAGALGGAPGVVAIGGTGSIVLGVDSTGERVRNYDFDQYADAAARHIGRRLVHAILANRWEASDRAFVEDVLAEWGFADMDELRRACIDGDHMDVEHSGNALDGIAPTITDAAADGVPLAAAVCADAAAEVALGIDLVAGEITVEPVPVAVLGSVIRSEGMRIALEDALAEAAGEYDVVEPALSPVAGAVLMSARRAGDADTAIVIDALAGHDACRIE